MIGDGDTLISLNHFKYRINMKKSELYGRHFLFGKDIIEIPLKEYYSHMLVENKDSISYVNDGSDSYTLISLDGCDYYHFCSHWNVGWQGDIDCDQFFCKVITLTKAERQEIYDLFKS